jgi:hypothetical protein
MISLLLSIFFSMSAMASDATNVAVKLTQMGFKCDGLHCRVRIADYSMPVDIFASPRLNRNRPLLLAYHLHGWWLNPNTSPFDGADGDFGKFLLDSGVNAVMIIPQSKGKNETYANELGSAARMSRFMDRIENLLRDAGVPSTSSTPRSLSGHSGAYVQMGLMGTWAATAEVPALKSLRGFGLLDSAYGWRDGLLNVMDVMCANGRATYLMAFNPGDGSAGKRDTNRKLNQELKSKSCGSKNILFYSDTAATHNEFPRKYLAAFLRETAKPFTSGLPRRNRGSRAPPSTAGYPFAD